MVEDREYLSYLAGFFDGEGAAMLVVSVRKNSSQRWNLNIYPNIQVHQHSARRFVLDEIKEKFGFGNVYLRNNGTMAHYQPTNRKDSKFFLEKLLPFLKIKKVHAEKILKAIEILDNASSKNAIKTKGERVLNKEDATILIEIAATLNEKLIGGGRQGRSREEMLALIEQVYEQPAVIKSSVKLKCQECDKEFERYNSDVANKNRTFCSKECCNNWMRREYPMKYKIDVVCANCKEIFKRIKSDVWTHKNNFCSPSCSNKFNAQKRKDAGIKKEHTRILIEKTHETL